MGIAETEQEAGPRPPGRSPGGSRRRYAATVRRYGPGLVLVAVGVAVSYAAGLAVSVISPLMIAVLLGAVVANTGAYLPAMATGVRWATKRLLRAGVVLLGLQLAVPDVLGLGWPTLLVVVGTVLATFFGTQWLGRRLGMRPQSALLIATGLSVCGASAVAAMDEVVHGEEDETATAIALVTIFGSLAIVVLPLLRGPLGMPVPEFGAWAGASVHEVAQVVATASAAGPAAVAPAVLVKLSRVVMLAPLVTGMSLAIRRRAGARAAAGTADGTGPATRLPPLVPLFVVGFLAAVGIRGTGVLSTTALADVKTVTTLLLCAALFGLGTGVHVRNLIRTGGRALLLGATSMVLICGVSYAGLTLAT